MVSDTKGIVRARKRREKKEAEMKDYWKKVTHLRQGYGVAGVTCDVLGWGILGLEESGERPTSAKATAWQASDV